MAEQAHTAYQAPIMAATPTSRPPEPMRPRHVRRRSSLIRRPSRVTAGVRSFTFTL